MGKGWHVGLERPCSRGVFHVEFLLTHISGTIVLILATMLEIRAAVVSFLLCRDFSLTYLGIFISLDF